MSTIAKAASGAVADPAPGQWAQELTDIIRGASGSFIFGIPLLYTMESWWIGSFSTPRRMLGMLITAFLAACLLNRLAGFRASHDVRIDDTLKDSVEALAIGLCCATFVLVLLREITPDTPLNEALGKLIFAGVPCTLGAALAGQFLTGSREDDPRDEGKDQSNGDAQAGQGRRMHATLADLGATLIGATILSFNISPTDEIPMLAAAIPTLWLLLIMAASLLISYGIVFAAGFANQEQRHQHQGVCQHPISETVLSYVVALVVAAFWLYFLQRLHFHDPWQVWLSHTIVLGLPTSIGGAAGRLAV